MWILEITLVHELLFISQIMLWHCHLICTCMQQKFESAVRLATKGGHISTIEMLIAAGESAVTSKMEGDLNLHGTSKTLIKEVWSHACIHKYSGMLWISCFLDKAAYGNFWVYCLIARTAYWSESHSYTGNVNLCVADKIQMTHFLEQWLQLRGTATHGQTIFLFIG